jgi:uncharacterized protein YacL
MERKPLGVRAGEHMTVGFISGVIFLAILERIKNRSDWSIIAFILVFFVVYVLAFYFFFLSYEKEDKKIKFAEWEEAMKLAQSNDPRINNRMYYVLRTEAIKSFNQEDQEILDTYTHEKIISKKADFILKVFKDLIPLYEEKDESQK